MIARHDDVRDVLAERCETSTGSVVFVEQNDNVSEDNRRPDFHYVNSKGITEHIDVRIVTPHARTSGGDTRCGRPGALISTTEKAKRTKYAHLALTPAVWSHLGRAGDDVVAFVRGLCADNDRWSRSTAISEIWQDIACTIQQQNARILSTAGPLCPP